MVSKTVILFGFTILISGLAQTKAQVYGAPFIGYPVPVVPNDRASIESASSLGGAPVGLYSRTRYSFPPVAGFPPFYSGPFQYPPVFVPYFTQAGCRPPFTCPIIPGRPPIRGPSTGRPRPPPRPLPSSAPRPPPTRPPTPQRPGVGPRLLGGLGLGSILGGVAGGLF